MPLKPGLIALIARSYDAILAQGLAFHAAQPVLAKAARRGRQPRRVGHNLLLRLSIRKSDVLRFLTDPRVPFTTNLAERDGRMMKLRQKISGGFRSEDGAKDFVVIRSLLLSLSKGDRQKTGLGSPPHPNQRSHAPDRRPPARVTAHRTWAVTAGVIFLDLIPAASVSGGLFDAPDSAASQARMRAIDALNRSFLMELFGAADRLPHAMAPRIAVTPNVDLFWWMHHLYQPELMLTSIRLCRCSYPWLERVYD